MKARASCQDYNKTVTLEVRIVTGVVARLGCVGTYSGWCSG